MNEPLASPCVGVCRINEASGLCEGCFRTLAEIAAWGGADQQEKRAVLQEVARRRACHDLFAEGLRCDCRP